MNWRIIGASVQGVSHVKADIVCQDAHAFVQLADGTLLIAVSDGAGSAAHAQRGAQLAVAIALAAAQKQPMDFATPTAAEAALRHALTEARVCIASEAAAQQHEMRDYAATLILVLVTATHTCALQIGDGAAVIADASNELHALTAPQNGEYVNETTFLIAEHYQTAAQFTAWEGHAQHLAVFSDGLQRLALKLPANEPHAPFFAPLFRFAAQAGIDGEAQLRAFLQSPRITERADDDLTLVLASRISS